MRHRVIRDGVATHDPRPVREPGRPLASSVRSSMERSFGHNFGDVRVHAGEGAARAAAALDARAYTLGRDIVFGARQYAPETPAGRALLAHELAHVIQQEHTGGTPRTAPMIGAAGDQAEHAANAAVDAAMSPWSPALGIADRLRAHRVTAPIIQRKVDTWGGEWDTTKYNLQAVAGIDGVEIELEFKPNDKVDATLIGTVQTARSMDKGGPVNLGGPPAEDAARKARTIQPPAVGAGTRIDRRPDYGNPLYAADMPGAKDRLRTTPTVAGWGKHGWRYMVGAVEHKESATLIDSPALSNALVESSQTFETTALAVSGAQEGTFYGSVQWGWSKNALGAVTMLPLTRVSKDVPSNVFAAATRRWNPSKTSTGADTLNLPIVFRGYATADNTQVVSDPTNPAGSEVGKLTKNTRVEVTGLGKKEPFNAGLAVPWWHVTVVSDVHAGKVGWILSSSVATNEVK